ncbi:copper resistance CopC family protein [Micromonospora sp. MW-13]|uniref:copper resistance CopC family protein n=1 Tax=Micromonospora sp. MW-13 TaxID=2094022 RepID=UPI001FB4C5F1|nr:copper resistance CopC family protein [Micromonospora sp. MW-13]
MALGVSLALPTPPASAHNSLTGSNPENGARVATAPARIELRFLAKPDPGTTKITVTGPDNVVALGGEPTFSGSRVRVPFAPGAAGLYIVGYQIASADGHPIKGEVRFTLTTGTAAQPPSPGAPSSAGTPSGEGSPSGDGSPSGATSPATPSAAPATDDPVSAAPAAVETADDGPSGWLWALGGVVLLAALGVALVVRRRATRS